MSQLTMFEQGPISFRMFYLQEEFRATPIEAFAEEMGPPLDALMNTPISGWVEGKNILGRNICLDTCKFGPYLHLTAMKAEKKIPAVLFAIECGREVEAEKRARDVDYLPRQVHSDIKARVTERLQPAMPPTITGTPFVANTKKLTMFAGAVSDSQLDHFTPFFKQTTGSRAIPVTPDTIARENWGDDMLKQIMPCSFSDDPGLELALDVNLGMDFLTWLWYDWERNGGTHIGDNGETISYMIEGPLTFFREGVGAHKAVLSNGSPTQSREAIAALMCGKKLMKMKFTLTHGEKIFSAVVDSDFAFRSMALPKVDDMEASERLPQRVRMLELFMTDWCQLFDHFMRKRRDTEIWDEVVVPDVKKWILESSQRM